GQADGAPARARTPKAAPASHDRRREKKKIDRPRRPVRRAPDEELQGHSDGEERSDSRELHGCAPLPPEAASSRAGEGVSTSTSISCENDAVGATPISRNRLPRETFSTRPITTPRG